MKMIEKHKKAFLYTLFFLTFLFFSLALVEKTFQNDTFYTIKVGEAISKYGVDMKDHFSFVEGLSYTYPHWLYDFLIYKLYSFGGFTALFISNIVLTFILASCMFITLKNVIKDEGVSFLVTILTVYFLSSFIAVRAQLVSYSLLLLILYSIEMIIKTNKNRYLLLAFISSILIVNMHCAVYYMSFIMFVPYLISDLTYIIKNKFFKNTVLIDTEESILQIDKPKNLKKLFIMIFLIILSGFIAPNAPVAFTYLPLQLLGDSTNYISEHSPASLANNVPLFFNLLMLIALILIPKVKIKIHDIFMILGLFIGSLLSTRSYALYLVLSVFAYGRILYVIIYNKIKYIKLSDIFRVKIVYYVFLILGLLSSSFAFYCKCQKEYVDNKLYPVEMVKYIKLNELDKDMRILNNYNFGSYLLFNDIKVFIDSRSDLYLPEFNKDCNQFMEAIKMSSNYKEMFEKYDFTHILLYSDSYLNEILEYRDDYRMIREDDHFVLYEKNNT